MCLPIFYQWRISVQYGHMKALLQIVSICVYAFIKQLNRVQGFLETKRHI
jgi:hypothetical protein